MEEREEGECLLTNLSKQSCKIYEAVFGDKSFSDLIKFSLWFRRKFSKRFNQRQSRPWLQGQTLLTPFHLWCQFGVSRNFHRIFNLLTEQFISIFIRACPAASHSGKLQSMRR